MSLDHQQEKLFEFVNMLKFVETKRYLKFHDYDINYLSSDGDTILTVFLSSYYYHHSDRSAVNVEIQKPLEKRTAQLYEFITWFIESGGDINLTMNKKKKLPITLAVTNYDYEMTKFLIAHQASINITVYKPEKKRAFNVLFTFVASPWIKRSPSQIRENEKIYQLLSDNNLGVR